jgi:hypothetical protein
MPMTDRHTVEEWLAQALITRAFSYVPSHRAIRGRRVQTVPARPPVASETAPAPLPTGAPTSGPLETPGAPHLLREPAALSRRAGHLLERQLGSRKGSSPQAVATRG